MTKSEQARLVAWRARLLTTAREETRSVAKTCRHFGISRQAFYKWKNAMTRTAILACATGRECSPRATAREVVSKVLHQ